MVCSSQAETSNWNAIFLVFVFKTAFKGGFCLVLFVCLPPLFIESLLTFFFFKNTHVLALCLLQHLDSVVEKALLLKPTGHHVSILSSRNVSQNLRAVYRRPLFHFTMTLPEFICFIGPEEQNTWRRSLDCRKNAECHNWCLYTLFLSTTHSPQTLKTIV